MKKYIFLLICLITFFIACSDSNTNISGDDMDNCNLSSCPENSKLIDCSCICDDGFMGDNCSQLDAAFTQLHLNNGKTPFELINANIPIDSLYGKKFKEGYIFHLNTVSKIVKIANLEDAPTELNWPQAIEYCNTLVVNDVTD